MRVLIAPDCFGDSLSAPEAAAAIAAGWGAQRPGDTVITAPQSDGGPGFVAVLAAADSAMLVHHSTVSGPLTEEVNAAWAYDPATATAYLESAQACGLALLGGPPSPHSALAAQSTGVGQLIESALRAGAHTIVVGLGGSCCTDGGRGMCDALGGLAHARRRLDGVRLIAATDVEHPLLGPAGAAHIFGPQKGADAATVEMLEQRMRAWADRLESAAGHAVRDLPGAGAAGGVGAALLALGGRRESGALLVAERSGVSGEMAGADLLITGEGRLDDQSLHGKVVGTLAGLAGDHGLGVLVLAGQVDLDAAELAEAGIGAAYSLVERTGSVQRALDDAAAELTGLAAHAAVGVAEPE